MSTVLLGNVPTSVSVQAGRPPPNKSCVTVLLSDSDPVAQWRFDFFVYGHDGGSNYVGSLVSGPIAALSGTRVVGMVCVPGAVTWDVRACPHTGTPPDAVAAASLLFGDATLPGFFPLNNSTVSYV